jgi:hypothetical protein
MKKTNIYAEFRIMGDAFDPDAVTQALSVQPTKIWRKGDCVYNNQGKITTLRQYTNWGYQTAVTETLDINTPIRTLQAVFADKTNTLLNLQKQYDLYFSIDIVIEVENNQPPAMCLQGFILEFAAALHARIDMDMYILEAEQ